MAAGAAMTRCTELLDAGIGRALYVAVMPRTVMALVPHPTELGMATLAWERSLASLSFATAQPLRAEGAIKSGARPRTGSSGIVGAIASRLRGRPRTVSSEMAAADASEAISRADAMGVLLAFEPEAEGTAGLLRVRRAGGATDPSGPLQKRPAGARAGAWRLRDCTATTSAIEYRQAGSARLRGSVPLDGPWVSAEEAAPSASGPEAAVSAERDFVVRTVSTFHEFRAADGPGRAAWLRGIRERACAVAAGRSSTFTLVCSGASDAERLASSIEAARAALTLAPVSGSDPRPRAPSRPEDDDGASLALALQLQEEERARAAAGRAAMAQAPRATAPAPAQGPVRVWPLYLEGQPTQWTFIDDFGREQGPFPVGQMREWLEQGFFGPETMVRCRSVGVPGVEDADDEALAVSGGGSLSAESVAAAATGAGRTALHQPLFALFRSPMDAFSGSFGWVPSFNLALRFQKLLAMAASLGVEPSTAMEAVQHMRRTARDPDLTTMLELIHAQRSPSVRPAPPPSAAEPNRMELTPA